MQAYLQTSCARPDGGRDSFCTQVLPAQIKPLWWQEQGLQFTASGYGRRIPTRYMVRFNGRWRRVYCCQVSNAGTCYIGKIEEHLIISEVEK